MKNEHFDFLVIGGGSAGYAAARTAREKVERVAIVDCAPELGGLCILRGCMPSKTLIYTAEILHHARHGAEFGLNIPTASANMAAVQQRKREIIGDFADYRRGQLESDRFTLFRNRARFIDGSTVELDDGRRVSADKFLISTGSTVATPPVPGLAESEPWTSDDVLDLDFLPSKTIVLGGGIVACELAQFLNRVGSGIVQIQRSPHVLKEFPPGASTVVETVFRKEGIDLYTDTRLKSVARDSDRYAVSFEHEGRLTTVEAPHLVNALGRRPATADLDLDAAGVKLNSAGQIVCNEVQQSSNPSIYAAGDVAGPHEIVHVAILQGETAARHATGRKAVPVDYDSLVTVVFTDPQIAKVGLSAIEISERDIEAVSADYPFNDHGKSILMNAEAGYVRVHATRDNGRVIGAECVGKDAGELIHALSVAVSLKATVFDLLKAHWYHPTLSEIWTYPLEEIAEAIESA